MASADHIIAETVHLAAVRFGSPAMAIVLAVCIVAVARKQWPIAAVVLLFAASHAFAFTADELAFITCPIGVSGITGKEPEVIAVSVAAQLLQQR